MVATEGSRATYPRTENSRLIETGRTALLDRLLHAVPERAATLAQPPAGSGLRAVRGDLGIPLVGSGLGWLRWGPAQQIEQYRRWGPVTWSKTLGQPIVTVTGPDAAQVVVANKDKAFGQGWEYYIGPFFHRGLLLLEFEEHMFHRRLMQQAFTRPRLEQYFTELTELANRRIASWPTGRTIHLYSTLKALTLEVAAEIFMDADVGAERDRLNRAFIAATHAALAVVRAPVPGGNWRAGLRGRKVLEDYFYRMLPAKRSSAGNDFFSALCHARDEDGSRFTDADVVNHMIFLIMAAHDTSTTTATSVAYFLGKHPEWQERARAESLARPSGPLDMQVLEAMTTLEMCIKESLRLVSPVPGLVRRTVADTEILGYYVPAGVLVDVNVWANHLLAEYWPQPERFDPERFSPQRREDKSHRYAWMPFGAGAHKCIGMHFGMLEVKTILDAMLRNFEWSYAGSPSRGYEMPWGYSTISFPRDDAPIVLRRR
ncbi:cytochrome P450 [Skermania sp. ID1734]|uniref:cytochrome P450 n=1 Tax=Skermania sp. ID1734 TaxID=2597516 RepID=UPI00117D07FE|nr:cytochrome P450 [Skermania sp. ID1734]TSE01438.1 cytochrome P450 [Skermania sp. ID1734]